MNTQLTEKVGRVVEIYREVNVPFLERCKHEDAIISLKEQKELSKKSTFGEWAISTIIADIPFTMLMYMAKIPPLILLPFMIITIIIIHKKIHDLNFKKQNYDERIAKQEQLVAECQAKIDEIVTSHADEIFSVFPVEFLKKLENIEMFEHFYSIVAEGRADTMKEAVNVFYDDMRKMRIEENSRHAAYCQEQALIAARNASFQAQRAADNIEWQTIWGNH